MIFKKIKTPASKQGSSQLKNNIVTDKKVQYL